MRAGRGPVVDLSCTYIAGSGSTSAGNPYVFSNRSIGAEPYVGFRRWIVVSFAPVE